LSNVRIAATPRVTHNEKRFFKYALIAAPTFVAFLLAIILYTNSGDEHHATAKSTPISAVEPANQKPTTPPPPRTEPTPQSSSISEFPKTETPIPVPPQSSRLKELRGTLARRREYDLWLIRNVSNVVNSALANESRQGKMLSYCMVTVHGAEQSLDSAPEIEYALQADGTVLSTPGKPQKTPEQLFRDSRRSQLELETGGGPLVQDCAGSLFWFGTWHNQPMPTDEKLTEMVAKAKADLNEIDEMLDARLVEVLPKPKAQ